MLQAVAFSSKTLVRMPIFLSPIVIVSTLKKNQLVSEHAQPTIILQDLCLSAVQMPLYRYDLPSS